ncbi:MAG TPA: hypothetical protein VGU69_02420, partial [Rhizomicrobium sp.]|nr:hypothetical protein [Rhizomicrobium sp.]
KIARRVMENLEVREDLRPKRDGDRGRGGRNGKGGDRNRRDKFRPDKFHDHVASMEPSPASETPAAAPAVSVALEAPVARVPEQPAPQERPRHEKRHDQPRRERNSDKPREAREPRHRAHQDRKNDATPVKPEKHELPAFLFRPINLPKKSDSET